jgi:hypothetical protein
VRSDADAGKPGGWVAPSLEFACELLYDESGLLLDYPGIASREA